MIDHLTTVDAKIVRRACEAMRLKKEFRVTVHRHTIQKWRGQVMRIARVGCGFEIEVLREDV